VINHPSPKNFWRWFDPRNRQIGTWAFILNRVTALGLSLYLLMHLIALSQLASGAAAYDGFVAFAKNPIFKCGEMLVIAAGLIHGLNGIRVAMNSFGWAVRIQKQAFIGLMALAVVGIALFGYIMFFGA
jgi:succinate dehydrogenase / fumarate reductase, cytochrome b subunit